MNPADVVVVPGTPRCVGDLFEDELVNGADLGILLSSWGACGSGSCVADLNGDSRVDGADPRTKISFLYDSTSQVTSSLHNPD